jgi:hypothetical protein
MPQGSKGPPEGNPLVRIVSRLGRGPDTPRPTAGRVEQSETRRHDLKTEALDGGSAMRYKVFQPPERVRSLT